MNNNWVPYAAVDIFQTLGFRFHLDFDDELIIESPAEVPVKVVEYELSKYAEEISRIVRRKAANERRRFVGGPFHGKPASGYSTYCGKGLYLPVSRGKWAVYVTKPNDERLYFLHNATSKAKARAIVKELFRARKTKG